MKTSTVRSWAVIGVVTTLLALSACAKTQKVGGASGLGGSAPTTAPGVPGSSGGTGAQPSSAATTTAATATKTTKPPASGPRIVSFVVVQQPKCPVIAASDSPFSAPGADVIVKWQVTGATKVALSLDDPNYYATNKFGSIGTDFPTSGSEDLPFECDPTVQPNTTHKYTLNTVGGGPSVAQTLTISKQTSP